MERETFVEAAVSTAAVALFLVAIVAVGLDERLPFHAHAFGGREKSASKSAGNGLRFPRPLFRVWTSLVIETSEPSSEP